MEEWGSDWLVINEMSAVKGPLCHFRRFNSRMLVVLLEAKRLPNPAMNLRRGKCPGVLLYLINSQEMHSVEIPQREVLVLKRAGHGLCHVLIEGSPVY